MLNIRSNPVFNDLRFQEGEKLREEWETSFFTESEGMKIVLEVGMGKSVAYTREQYESMLKQGEGKVKLIRIGLDADGLVWDTEDAVGVQGDIGRILKVLNASI